MDLYLLTLIFLIKWKSVVNLPLVDPLSPFLSCDSDTLGYTRPCNLWMPISEQNTTTLYTSNTDGQNTEIESQ